MRNLLLLIVLILTTSFVQDPSPCLKDLQLHFFETSRVNEVLSMYQVRQELWNPIVLDLQFRTLEVPEIMKRMTNRMVPNPIEYPMNKFETARLLKTSLLQVFRESLKETNATQRGLIHVQESTIDLMFNYLLYKKLPKLIDCFGPKVQELVPQLED